MFDYRNLMDKLIELKMVHLEIGTDKPLNIMVSHKTFQEIMDFMVKYRHMRFIPHKPISMAILDGEYDKDRDRQKLMCFDEFIMDFKFIPQSHIPHNTLALLYPINIENKVNTNLS